MLTPRIKAIVEFVDRANVAADIGCDHGYAAKALVDQQRSRKVIACDVSKPSLQKTVRLVLKHNLTERIETRLGNGLEPLLDGEADVIIVAGMGGWLIRDIISRGERKAREARLLVLAPNRNDMEVRRYLCENGYEIVSEALAEESGRYYQVICAREGAARIETDDFYYDIGRKLLESGDVHLKAYLGKRIEEADDIISKASRSAGADMYIAGIEGRKRRMEEVEKCL